jgi:hypothetical protein
MAKVKSSKTSKANTVELLPTLGTFDEWGPSFYERHGWLVQHVHVRGQGGIGKKKEHYNERSLDIPLKNKVMQLAIKDRQYSLFRSVCVKGPDFVQFRDWVNKNLPFFSCSVSSVTIKHKASGTVITCRSIGRHSKNPLSKKFIAYMMNGSKMTPKNVHTAGALLDGLVYGYCSYGYGSRKINVICDN